ncbi:MAG: chloride channel protein, partial [Candidatus Tectimicrobiota bacterium]
GVPEVMESTVLRGGLMRPRTIVLRALASAISVGSGGSAGREGPIVQIGAAIGSTVGQLCKMSSERLRLLVGCGTAAGIAATFNAPLSGTFFALEIVLGERRLRSLSPLLVASVIATVVSRATIGPAPAFSVPAYGLVSVGELVWYLALGVLCGLAAYGAIRLLYAATDWFEDALPRVPPVLKPALGGLAVGGVAVAVPQVLGNGYPAVAAALRGELPLYLLAILVLFKMGTTATTLGSGGSGGFIAPSLFIGAMVGGAVGSVVHGLLPSWTAAKGAYAVAGMGAVLAAATHAPLTPILLLFELTDGVSLMLPAATTILVAVAVARRLDADSIYTWKLTRRGINVARGWEVSTLGSLFVREAMRTEVEVIPDGMSYREIRRLLDQSATVDFPVVDGEGRLTGLLSLREFSAFAFEPELHDTVIARDLATPQRLLGMLRRHDLLAAYDRAVIARAALR